MTQRPDRAATLEKIRRLGEQTASPDTGIVSFPHITAAFRLQRSGTGVVGEAVERLFTLNPGPPPKSAPQTLVSGNFRLTGDGKSE